MEATLCTDTRMAVHTLQINAVDEGYMRTDIVATESQLSLTHVCRASPCCRYGWPANMLSQLSYSDPLWVQAYAKAHEKLSLLGSNLSSNPIELKIADSSPEYAVTATEV